jgi:hypothetical protein
MIEMNERNKFDVEEKTVNHKVVYENDISNPPLVVVVQGGKKVFFFNFQSGKSTLIRSLVKYYTNQNVNNIQGSITIRNCINFFNIKQKIRGYRLSNARTISRPL